MSIDFFSLVVTLVTTVLSIWVTVYLTLNSITKDLKYLVSKDKNDLTYPQAINLAELYIFHIQTIIKLKTERYIEKSFVNRIDEKSIKNVERFINDLTHETVEIAKHKFSPFELYGGGTFSDLITELLNDKDSVTENAKAEALELFIDCAKQGICGDELKDRIIILINKSGTESKSRIIERLKKRYYVQHH